MAGDIAICEYDRSRTYTLDRPADSGVIVLADELMREVSQETRYLVPDIQTFPVLRDVQLARLSQILLDEALSNYENGSLFTDSVATSLAHYLWNKYPASNSPRMESAGGLAPALLRKSIEYIQENLDCDIRLIDLAAEVGLSRSHYIRGFRQSMGVTPHQFVLSQRIERAQLLIRKGTMSLAAVALSCGFADQHHLARTFRRFTGMTPGMFRRSL
ncbi:AraC family transcriptional regulator [Silvibacterium bohemicum]|uniref:AraC family transcriptional regulator n=1 Tax=Silvibacterium bohemicum TaxID=1577686 RepID=A0A841JUL5_9BACT|nr:AraC family transcriptional regulator [Silvibacterium bohemicum]MBB6144157.1 AraC family transcriptional regulator [Silvibacterium bohemicum]